MKPLQRGSLRKKYLYAIRELPTMPFPNGTDDGLQAAGCAVSFAYEFKRFCYEQSQSTVQITPGEMN
ncbi:hypothetical protein [Flavobacterium sp.]